MTISFNPVAVNNFPGSFSIQSQGYIQGFALDDPAVMPSKLSVGYLASTETLPMWGGLPLTVTVPNPASSPSTPNTPSLARATANALTGAGSVGGFSVFNQAAAAVQTPSSPVPLAGPLMSVNFFRLGSTARIVVPISAALVSALGGGGVLQNVQTQWDFTNNVLTTYTSGTALPVLIERWDNLGNSKVVSYTSPNATWGTGYTAVIII
jgi:hypothetical protein